MKTTITVLTLIFSMHLVSSETKNFGVESITEKTATDGNVTSTFSISNLGCSSDAADMQKAIARTKGVKNCKVNAKDGTALVVYDESKITKEEITKIIENCSLCHDKTAKPFKVTEVK